MMNKKPFDAGLIARAASGMRYIFTGDWFGAGIPPEAVAPESVKGRRYDYPAFINVGSNKPRANEAIGFEHLRSLADNYDLLRLIIERRKDQIAKLDWTIQRRDIAATSGNESAIRDKRLDELIAFFRMPDKEHTWDDWLRMLLEDLLVVDAPCIYPRYTKGGKVYSLEPIDGATIKRVLDDTGRTPLPPEPAYQQILKGMAAVNYSRDELIYRPRNPRTYKVYGCSPVEQVITTVNIAMRRQVHQLDYYREGSVPDALVGVPDSWSSDEIRRFQEYWDLLLSGESAARRKMRFVPGDLARNFKETKQPPLKDEYDEWLARVVCFCFSIEPTPFVKQQNRATADTAREQSISEGLVPLQKWVKSLIDDILARLFDAADYEFIWDDEESIDPQIVAGINCQYVAAGILTVDEVRAELGREPLPEQEPTKEPRQQPQGDNSHEELAEKVDLPVKKPENPAISAEDEAYNVLEPFLQEMANNAAAQVYNLTAFFNKSEDGKSFSDWIVSEIKFAAWSGLVASIFPILRRIVRKSGDRAINDLGVNDDEKAQEIRQLADEWAQNRAAEMIGMRWVGDALIPNPNAKWQITESTREMIRDMVHEAIDGGWSSDKLAAALRDSFAFSSARARMIARTEIGNADMAGKVIGWRESGIVIGKIWVTVGDDKVSEPCVECAAAGAIPLDAPFPSGKIHPLNHPNCRCNLSPVLIGEPMGKANFNPYQLRAPKGFKNGGRWISHAAILTGNELGEHENAKSLRKAGMEYAGQHFIGNRYENENSGHLIKVTRQGVKHALSRANSTEIKLIAGLDRILTKAKYQGSEPDKKGRGHIKAAHFYMAVVKIGGEKLNIGIVTHEKHDGHEHYDHFILKDE